MKNSIFIILSCLSFLLAQYDQDARMLGLSGAYTNISEGFSCVGINPANLSYGSNFSINRRNDGKLAKMKKLFFYLKLFK